MPRMDNRERKKTGRPPKFPHVKQQIRNAIIQGRLQPEQRLPTFHEVARNMGVGSVTAKRAIDELISEGWLHARQGVGTFVNPRSSIAPIVLTISNRNNPLYYLLSETGLDEFHRQNPRVRILFTAEADVDLVVTDTYGMIFRCVRGQPIHSLDRLRTELGLPVWELPGYMRSTAEWQGELFGLPLHMDMRVVQTNPAVLRAFGLTPPTRHLDWETFHEILHRCRKDGDGDGVLDCFGTVCHLPTYEWKIPFWQNGGRLDKEEAFFQPSAIEAIDRLWRLIHVDRVLPMEMPIAQGEMFMKQVRRRFDDGKLALRFLGTRELFHATPFPTEILLPSFGPVERQFIDGILMGISRTCAYPEIAMKFLDFCYRSFVQNNSSYPFALTESERARLSEQPRLSDLLKQAVASGCVPLQEGLPERTWAIENEIFQWFRLYQDRSTTMARIRKHWRKARSSGASKPNASVLLGNPEEASITRS